MSKFSVEKYTIYWHSVYLKEDINQVFKNFLKDEMNLDPFECVEMINKMKATPLKEQNQLFVAIIETFVDKNSEKQVNISGKDYEILLKLYQDAKDAKLKNPVEDLSNLKMILEQELYLDNFPRFIRCKNYINLFQKYKDDSQVMCPAVTTRFSLNDNQFDKLIATESELDFMMELSKDSFEWQHIHGNKNINLYFSDTDFLPYSKFFKGSSCIKADAILPYNYHRVLTVLNHERLNDAFNIKRTNKILTFYSVEDLKKLYPESNIIGPCIDIDETLHFPFPFNTPRRLKITITMLHVEKDHTVLILIKPSLGNLKYKDKEIDWSKKNPLNDGLDGYYVPTIHLIKVKKVADLITHVTHIKSKSHLLKIVFNFRGYLNQAKQMVPIMIKMLFGTTHQKIDKLLETMEEKTRKDLEELKNDPFAKLILEIFPNEFISSPLKKITSTLNFMELFKVNYERIKTHKEVMEGFRSFMLKDNNYSFLLIDSINEIKFYSKNEKNNKVLDIVELFILDKSPKYVYLCKSDQETLIDFYKKAKESTLENIEEIFQFLLFILDNHIMIESFPRFIRNKESQILFHKSAFNDVLIPYDSIRLDVVDDYFTKLPLTKLDIEFALKLLDDNLEWEHILGSKLTNLYLSKTNYIPNSKFFKGCNIIKGETIISNNIEKCFRVIKLENMTKTISPVSTVTHEYISKEILKEMYPNEDIYGSCQILNHNIILPFPLNTPRKLTSSVSFIYLKEKDTYLFIMKPYLGNMKIKDFNIDWSQKDPLHDGFDGYYVSHFHIFTMKKLSENETCIKHVKFFDLRGLMTSTKQFIHLVMKLLFGSIHDDVEKKIETENKVEMDKNTKEPFLKLVSEVYEFQK